jgi:hypothetical protein
MNGRVRRCRTIAVQRRESVAVRDLAVQLAHGLLSPAHQVLAGGPHTTTKAIELAEYFSNRASPALTFARLVRRCGIGLDLALVAMKKLTRSRRDQAIRARHRMAQVSHASTAQMHEIWSA